MRTVQQYVALGHSREFAAELVAGAIAEAVRQRAILWRTLEEIGDDADYRCEIFGGLATPELRGPCARTCEASIIPAAWCESTDISGAIASWQAAIAERRDSLLAEIIDILDPVSSNGEMR